MELDIHPPLPRRKDFRIGILGSGFIVSDCHLVAYRKAGFNPVAIASRNWENASRTAERHGIPIVYVTYEQLLDNPEIEVLDIAVPPNAQLDLIKAACERKIVKGILAQKPLGMNYAEAVEAVQACEAAGITLAVNQNMRYDQSVRAGKTLLEKGVLGKPVFATIEMRAIPHWMPWHEDLGWLTLRIMSIHHLDTFRYWFGDPERIYCSVRTDPRTKFPHTDGICTYILEYANGLRCVGIDDTWTGPAKEGCLRDNYIRWRIEGTDGLAIGDIGWCKEPFTTPSTIRYASKGDATFHEPRWTESWFPDAFVGTMGQLLIALESKTEPEISGRDNLKTMVLVEAAYLSASQFRSVDPSEIEPAFAVPRRWSEKKAGFFKRLLLGFTEKHPTPSVTPAESKAYALGNFTPRAQQALALARKEADRFNHNFVGTEHLLLGIIRLGQGVAVNVLQKLGFDLQSIRKEVEKQVGTGPDQKIIGNIPYTPRVKKVLSLAAKEAKALSHTYVGTEHILMGLLREGDGVAARVLTSLGVKTDRTREEILKELDPNFAAEYILERQSLKPMTPAEIEQAEQAQVLSEFTPRAQQVLGFARKEADSFNHTYVGTEHLLLGLIRLGSGVAVTILKQLGMDLEATRKEVLKHVAAGPPQKAYGHIPYTPPLKRALAYAAKEAHQLHHSYVGTEHVLLGILGLEEGIARKVFEAFKVDVEKTRLEILKELGPNRTD